MAISINSNIVSLEAQAKLNRNSDAVSNSLQKLSSNLRVNSSSDEVSLISVASKMKFQMENSNQQIKSAMETNSILQTASAALDQTQSTLSRMKDLATKSADASTDSNSRLSMHSEFASLAKEITKISNDTNFNGKNILSGSYERELQSAVGESSSIKFNDMSSEALGVSNLSISTAEGGLDALSKIDEALKMVNEQRSTFSKEQSHINENIFSLSLNTNNQTTANQKLDANSAAEKISLTKLQMLSQLGSSMLAQANNLPPSHALFLLRG